MKKLLASRIAWALAAVILIGLALLAVGPRGRTAGATEPLSDPAGGAVSSIKVEGQPSASQRVALAKISFAAAMKAALKAVPGRIVSGELDVDEGELVYSFVIVTPKGKVMEVDIDPGNGKVLDVEEGQDGA